MNIKIERAKIEDLKDVQSLNLKLFEKEYRDYDKLLKLDWTFGSEGTQYYVDRITKPDGCVFVAKDNDKIVGYLAGGLTQRESYRNLPISAELENTYILEDYRSNGIGSKLYAEFLHWCKDKNVRKVVVEVSAQNELGLNFYRKNDFKDYSVILEADI
jgi:ribosomal protein S18 acetylase RimI-like enzyme